MHYGTIDLCRSPAQTVDSQALAPANSTGDSTNFPCESGFELRPNNQMSWLPLAAPEGISTLH